MGNAVDVMTEHRDLIVQASQLRARGADGFRQRLTHKLQIQRQDRHPLAEIVVQFSRQACAFLFLRPDHPPIQVRQGRARNLQFGHVDRRTDVSGERSVRSQPRLSAVEHPSIRTVRAPQPILNPVRFAPLERGLICTDALGRVCGVDALEPAIPQFLLQRSTGELEPRDVEIGRQPVGVRQPDHHGRRIREHAEAAFTLAHCLLCTLPLAAAHQKRGDQQRLGKERRRSGDDDPPEAFPRTPLAKLHDAPRGQPILGYSPALQFPPVVDHRNLAAEPASGSGRRRALQDLKRRIGGRPRDQVRREQVAADDATAELGAVPGEERRVRPAVNVGKRSFGRVGRAVHVHIERVQSRSRFAAEASRRVEDVGGTTARRPRSSAGGL